MICLRLSRVQNATLRRSLHVKNCRDRLIISSGFQEKGGCPLIRACSVITSNTVYEIEQVNLWCDMCFLLCVDEQVNLWWENVFLVVCG